MVIAIRDALNQSSIYEVKALDNLDALVNPTVNDDSTLGYTKKSTWFNQATGESYLCIDSSEGAAIWVQTSLTVDDLGSAAFASTADFATAAQGLLANTAVQPAAIADFETSVQLALRDTANRDRANHTGVQSIATVTGLQTELDGKINLLTNMYFIRSKADLPAPVGGVITLLANSTYFFTTTIDLTGDRLVCAGVVTLLGGSSETTYIQSTGLHTAQPGQALLTTTYSIPIQNLTFDGLNEGYPILNFDALGNNGALDWYGVNIKDAPTIGVVKDYANSIMKMGSFLSCGSLTFDGTFGTIAFDHYFGLGRENGTLGIIASTCVINARFRMNYSTIVTLTGGTGLNVENVSSFPNPESALLNRVNFSGPGTPITSTLAGTNRSLFVACNGVPNRACFLKKSMENNAVATDIVTTNVAVPMAGTFITHDNEKFTSLASTEFEYDGAFLGTLAISVSAALDCGTNNRTLRMELRVDRNDGNGYVIVTGGVMRVRTATAGQPYNVSLPGIIDNTLPGYTYQVWVANESGDQDVTVTDAVISVARLV